jgi:hypothetical protein
MTARFGTPNRASQRLKRIEIDGGEIAKTFPQFEIVGP